MELPGVIHESRKEVRGGAYRDGDELETDTAHCDVDGVEHREAGEDEVLLLRESSGNLFAPSINTDATSISNRPK